MKWVAGLSKSGREGEEGMDPNVGSPGLSPIFQKCPNCQARLLKSPNKVLFTSTKNKSLLDQLELSIWANSSPWYILRKVNIDGNFSDIV